MKANDQIHGFKVVYTQELPEIGATLWRMTYEKNGADLIWLERADDNKTFAIAFKTIPRDDTGVFHILEHSVLSGSDKYPLKEPFVELIKSSMATFLNAFTFPDKTMYPISSRNGQDFLNLMDVYLDAVLHPLSMTDPHAFRQEGWHYELDSPQDTLRCNGVVYNEMKGAYASHDTVLASQLNQLLFPDTCYGFESGGHPDHIPELTYQNYLESHHRFYHPSNARIILDGTMNIAAVLAKLDEYLSPYERLEMDTDIPYQSPVAPAEKTACYEIGAEEAPDNKAIWAKGWVFGDYRDIAKGLAVSVLADVLTASNEAPLSKALLDADLCEDVYFHRDDGIQQRYTYLVVQNFNPQRVEEVKTLVGQVLTELADNGLDHQRLHNALNRMEFVVREKDFGNMPRGLVYAINSLDTWLYGGDPAQGITYGDVFARLHQQIDEGRFEQILREVLLENPHTASVLLLPSPTLGEEKRAAEQQRLQTIQAQLSPKEQEQIIREFAQLKKRQEADDSPKQLAALPRLSLADIPVAAKPITQELHSIDGITVLHQPLETNGITYLTLYFSLADQPQDRLSRLSFFSTLPGRVATRRHSALELQSELQGTLGHFGATCQTFTPAGQTEQTTPMLAVKLALLDSNKAGSLPLLDEILNHSDFSDENLLYNLLRQSRLSMEQTATMQGDSFAMVHVAASGSAMGAVDEALVGLEMLRYLQQSTRQFEQDKDDFCRELAEMAASLFSKQRLTMSITGRYDEDWLRDVLALLADAPMGTPVTYVRRPISRDGFVIPAEIGFAAKSANLNNLQTPFSGVARVAAQWLSYDYLWNEIRVKGGAYGTGMNVRVQGDVTLTSYRDPSPAQTLESFDRTGQALRDTIARGDDPEKYIISTIAATEPVLTPKAEGERAAACYFTQRTQAQRQQERLEILQTTGEDLIAFSHELDAVCRSSGVCVIGGKSVLDACQEQLDSVEPIT